MRSDSDGSSVRSEVHFIWINGTNDDKVVRISVTFKSDCSFVTGPYNPAPRGLGVHVWHVDTTVYAGRPDFVVFYEREVLAQDSRGVSYGAFS